MRYFSILLLLVAFSCARPAQELTILHLNDTHSHIEPERHGDRIGYGGVIEQAAYIDSVRCADGKNNVLLLHAGDFSQGSSYFRQLRGDVEVDVINAMKFDAVCLGNHEFDNGIDELARRLANLEVPVVCANFDFSATTLADYIKPYVILEKAGKKIGIIGLLPDLSSLVDPKIAEIIKFQDPYEVAENYAGQLKAQGCDLVICLTHLGYDMEDYSDVLLAYNTKNVDLIVGGHSHTRLNKVESVSNLEGQYVGIVQNGKWGLDFGTLKVKFPKK